MKITEEQIDQLAKLSRLEFRGEQRERIRQDLEQMLSYMEKLQEVDTSGLEPLTHMAVENCPLREDIAETPLNRAQALKNAPQTDGEYFLVPKVIQK